MKGNWKSSMAYLFVLLLAGCNVQKKSFKTFPANYDITELESPFRIKIIDYIPAFPCGTKAFASICLGEMINGDTIRVLSLCNMDSTYKTNQLVDVIPEKKPTFVVSTSYILINSNSNTRKTDYKTIFGRLVKH